MTWDDIDWSALDRLREGFLSGGAAAGPYWSSPEDLANYDFTYGERIGWKWDQVLRELRLRGWSPRGGTVLDWGCGSGIASRRVISFFGPENFDSLIVWDHSPVACDFAADRTQREFPNLKVSQATASYFASGTDRIDLLLISHVLNELSVEARDALRLLCIRADAIVWVEPGTHDVSRQLGGFREQLRGSGFRVVAPCTHENECPMFAIGRDRDWCHFFAPPPSEIFADSNWVKFGQRAGIDLRSLPYAFIAMDRRRAAPNVEHPTSNIERRISEHFGTVGGAAAGAVGGALRPDSSVAEIPSGHKAPPTTAPSELSRLSRVIGRVEHFKPYARLLNCDATGLTDCELLKRADPALFKLLERTKAPLVYRWVRDGSKIKGGEPLQM